MKLEILLLAFPAVVFTIILPVSSFSSSNENYLTKIDPTLVVKSKLSNENIKVIVWINKTKYDADKYETLSEFGKVKHQYDIIPAVALDIPPDSLQLLAEKDYVEKIEPVLKVGVFLQDTAPLIGAAKVWTQQIDETNITGKNTAVCILDTGVNYTHPDLGGCFGSGCKVIGGYDYVNSDNDPMDDNNLGHGTHVAGIVAANGGIKGVASNASIIAIKVLDSSGGGYTSDVIAGINWCTNNASAYNISVISMSFGTDILFSEYCDNVSGLDGIRDSINIAISRNISVVAASGNDGNSISISAPACIQNVTAVGATTKSDTIWSSSNRNNITDLVAPGSFINSTSKSGGYVVYSGTSMAVPHVSGTIALLYEKYKLVYDTTPTTSYLQQILNDTGIKINDTNGNNLNFPRINIYDASLVFSDTRSPEWSNLSNITTVERGESVNISVFWSDNARLVSALLSTNETGFWRNITTITLSGTSSWSNFTWQNSSLEINTVAGWRVYAKDSSGNQNVTNISTFTIINNTLSSGILFQRSAILEFTLAGNMQSILTNTRLATNEIHVTELPQRTTAFSRSVGEGITTNGFTKRIASFSRTAKLSLNFAKQVIQQIMQTIIPISTSSTSGSSGGTPTIGIEGCKENWNCSMWSECINGTQTITCIDLNKCNTVKNKPLENQSCEISIGGMVSKELNETPTATSKTEENPKSPNPRTGLAVLVDSPVTILTLVTLSISAIASVIYWKKLSISKTNKRKKRKMSHNNN